MKIFDTKETMLSRVSKYSNSEPLYEFTHHQKQVMTIRAKIATEMATKWGMVASKYAGEDSAGRAKLAVLTPSEVVERSVETADLLVTAFEKAGWFDVMPSIEELYWPEQKD